MMAEYRYVKVLMGSTVDCSQEYYKYTHLTSRLHHRLIQYVFLPCFLLLIHVDNTTIQTQVICWLARSSAVIVFADCKHLHVNYSFIFYAYLLYQ